jgi:glycosyltransferase involved in cell wall biosynthesis
VSATAERLSSWAAPPDSASVKPELSVVIPCLDEAATLALVIDKARAAMHRLGVLGEVVIADNGSRDGSRQVAEEHGARVVHVPQRGYGNALRHGMRAARGRFIVMGDADGTYDFGEIGRFLERLRAGADFVMGTRLPPGRILPGANPWLNRYLGTPSLTFILNRLFGARIRDVNCGMRALSSEAFERLALRSEGMEFASEMVIKAALLDLQIEEVPVTLHPDRRARTPHLRRWRDGWRHLEFMLLHAPDQLLFFPGAVALALGLLMVVPVALGPFHMAGRLFDFHFLFLGGALALIGLQGVLGSVLVRDAVEGVVLRPSCFAAALQEHLTLGRGLACAAALFATGFGFDLSVLLEWLQQDFGALHEPRRGVLGLVLMTVGAEVGLFSFLHAFLRKHA